jgi:hypothetical protein
MPSRIKSDANWYENEEVVITRVLTVELRGARAGD